jgi:anaerobic selenocysteine-containing dehydrogenase
MPHANLKLNEPVGDEVKTTTCYMCACRCGIKVHLKNGRVRYIQGNAAHPVNKGVLCAKGSAGIMQHYSPARFEQAVAAVGERGAGEFREIEWDEALALAAQWLGDIRKSDPDKLAFFTGRDQSQALTGWWAQQFGTVNYAAHGGFCSVNMAAAGMYTLGGSFWEFGEPDWDQSKYLLMFGVAEDHDSNPIKLGLGKLKGRGAKIVAINPVRTGYAAIADEWIGIRPGTDGLFIGALIRELLVHDRIDLDYLVKYTNAHYLVVRNAGGADDGLFARDARGEPLCAARFSRSPAGGGRPGWGQSSEDASSQARPHPNPPPHAGEGAQDVQAAEGHSCSASCRNLATDRWRIHTARRAQGRAGVPACSPSAFLSTNMRRRPSPAVRCRRRDDPPHRGRTRRCRVQPGDPHRATLDRLARTRARRDDRPARGDACHARHLGAQQRLPHLPHAACAADAARRDRHARQLPLPAAVSESGAAGEPARQVAQGQRRARCRAARLRARAEDLLVDAAGAPRRIDKAFSWEFPLAAHGMLQSVIRNAWAGDPYRIDTLFLFMANMGWNSAMNTTQTRGMLATVIRPSGEYRIPHIIYADAYWSETVNFADLVLPDTTYLERHDCIRCSTGPIPMRTAPAMRSGSRCAIRCRRNRAGRAPFQDVLIDLGTRLGLPGLTGEDGKREISPVATHNISSSTERAPVSGLLAGWRWPGRQAQAASANRIRTSSMTTKRIIATGMPQCRSRARYYKMANRDYLAWAKSLGFVGSSDAIGSSCIPSGRQTVPAGCARPLARSSRRRLIARVLRSILIRCLSGMTPCTRSKAEVRTLKALSPIALSAMGRGLGEGATHQQRKRNRKRLDFGALRLFPLTPLARDGGEGEARRAGITGNDVRHLRHHPAPDVHVSRLGLANAWLRQIAARNFLYLHPDTAQAHGIADGDWVWVESRKVASAWPAKFHDGTARGVVWTWNADRQARQGRLEAEPAAAPGSIQRDSC